MNNWKDKFVIYTTIAIITLAFVLIALGLNNKNQPSVEDVMTNNATSIEDFLE